MARRMENDELQKIVDALSENQRTSFFVEDALTPADITVEVEGVGNIDIPLTVNCIERLVSVSSKANIDLCDEKNLPREIVHEKVHVTIHQSSLTRILNKMREELKLKDTVLSPHLHNMSIYSPGQCCDLHQDLAKMDNMVIATLVIVLPSSHIGGDFVVLHGDKHHVFSTENVDEQNSKCVGFYADCMSKIKKVNFGYRVALTYNLLLNTNGSAFSSEMCNQRLKTAIQEYFVDHEVSDEPRELVYYLDHVYNEVGLNWRLLKGNDRTNAIAILEVARVLKLVPHLVLVDIHESFATDEDFYPLDERRDFDIKIYYWVNELNENLSYDELTSVDECNICWTIDTRSLLGYDQGMRYNDERYFRNRRSAIFLWPESSQHAMNFKLNHRNAMKGLLELTQVSGNERQVIEIIRKAGRYLRIAPDIQECFEMLLDIALYIRDGDVARDILSNFSMCMVNVSSAVALLNMQNMYGESWCVGLLEKWKDNSTKYNIKKIDVFVKFFMQNNGAVHIAQMLLDQQRIQEDNSYYDYSDEMAAVERIEELCSIFVGCAVIENVSILHKVIESVMANTKSYPILKLVDLFVKLQRKISSDYFNNFKPLKNYLVRECESELSVDNWSIENADDKIYCRCACCSEILGFLKSKTQVIKVIPGKLRGHVSRHLKYEKLPIVVSVETNNLNELVIKKLKPKQVSPERVQELKRCLEALNAHSF